MGIQNFPTGDRSFREWIRYWRPYRSNLLVFVEIAGKGAAWLLRWGKDLYLPVDKGDQLTVHVFNGNNFYVATPAFMGGANVYENGPSRPEICTPDDMWEAQPGGYIHMEGIHDHRTQRTRPFTIVDTGHGLTISEAKFGTTEFRGLFYGYERWQIGYGSPPRREWGDGWSTSVPAPHPFYWEGYPLEPPPVPGIYPGPHRRSGVRGVEKGVPESFRGGEEFLESTREAGPTRSFGESDSSLGMRGVKGVKERSSSQRRSADEGRAGVGLGSAKYQASHDTGVSYNGFSSPLYQFIVEYRRDLRGFGILLPPESDWFWSLPNFLQPWWETFPGWAQTGEISPEVPVAQPHRPRY